MNNWLILSDIQADYKEPYWYGIQKLFEEFLIPKYKDYTLIHVGDLYEMSSPHSEVRKKITEYLLQFKECHLLLGNHEYSKIKGDGTLEIGLHKNLKLYNEVTEVIIDNKKCLFLPYSYKDNYQEEYSNIKSDNDFTFIHAVPETDSFGGKFVDLKYVKSKYGIFWGHIHIPKDFKNYEIDNFIIGTIQPTRDGEQDFNPRIFLFEEDKLREEKLPIYMTIKDIEYGEELPNDKWLYNIKNAPSIQSVYAKYPVAYIREEGITVHRENIEFYEDIKDNNQNRTLLEEFLIYSKEKELHKEIHESCLEYLQGV